MKNSEQGDELLRKQIDFFLLSAVLSSGITFYLYINNIKEAVLFSIVFAFVLIVIFNIIEFIFNKNK